MGFHESPGQQVHHTYHGKHRQGSFGGTKDARGDNNCPVGGFQSGGSFSRVPEVEFQLHGLLPRKPLFLPGKEEQREEAGYSILSQVRYDEAGL